MPRVQEALKMKFIRLTVYVFKSHIHKSLNVQNHVIRFLNPPLKFNGECKKQACLWITCRQSNKEDTFLL
jgi:hypothetical protein